MLVVGSYLLYLAMAAVYAMMSWYRGVPTLSCAGLLLASGSPLIAMAWQLKTRTQLGRESALWFTLACGFGLAVTMAMSWRFGDLAKNIHVYAGLALLGWVVYMRWQRRDAQNLNQAHR